MVNKILQQYCSYQIFMRRASYIERKKNYYQILNVDRKATQDEVKKAFVKRSQELHPDVSKSAKAVDMRHNWSRRSMTEQFMDVKEAYDTLRYPHKRKLYDQQTFLSEQEGYLHEASFSGPKRKDLTIVDLNLERNKSYMGPQRLKTDGGHFIDPVEEYEKERTKNRPLLYIVACFGVVILCNVVYVEFTHSQKRKMLK